MMKGLLGSFNYGAAIFLIAFGLYAVAVKTNLIRKIIGLTFLQTGVILFYITLSYKEGAILPIVPKLKNGEILNPDLYANPLPAALMLTAIVVGVSTLGVALALALSIYRTYGTLEEDEILKKV